MTTPSDPTRPKRLSTSTRTALIVIPAAILLAVVAIAVSILARPATPAPSADAPASAADVVAADSHVLDDGGPGAPTLVEFLDFECEACGAFYPIVEDLREKYAGDITYVVRYFPLPGHVNSTQAALATEAAAGQDRFEDMYRMLFETQSQWGEQQRETPEVFRGFAEDLGLDLAAYDAAVADPATLARVEADKSDGDDLGVRSTPSFFIDGRAVELQQWGDLEAAIEKAVNG